MQDIQPRVQGYFKEFLKSWPEHHPGIIFKEVNTDLNYIYILASIHPTKSVGMAVRLLKSSTSQALNKQFPRLRKVYWGAQHLVGQLLRRYG